MARPVCLVLLLALLAGPARSADPPEPGPMPRLVDRYGDQLPPGAIARLGTVRLRHPREVYSVLFSTDGETVIAGGPLVGSTGESVGIHFWNTRTGKLVRRLQGQPFGSGCLALSPDGKLLASESGASIVWIWDLTTGRPVHKLPFDKAAAGNIYVVAFSPDGKTLAVSGTRSSIQLWDVRTGKLCRSFGGDDGPRRLAYSRDGKTIAWSGASSLHLWDVATAKEIWQVPMSPGGSQSLAFSPDGRILASGGEDGDIWLVRTASGEELRRCRGEVKKVNAVAFSPNGKALASGGEDNAVRIWDVATGKPVGLCRGHQSAVYSVAYSPDGETIASGGFDHTVRLWEAATGRERFPRRRSPEFGVFGLLLTGWQVAGVRRVLQSRVRLESGHRPGRSGASKTRRGRNGVVFPGRQHCGSGELGARYLAL